MIDSLSIAVHAFVSRASMSFIEKYKLALLNLKCSPTRPEEAKIAEVEKETWQYAHRLEFDLQNNIYDIYKFINTTKVLTDFF